MHQVGEESRAQPVSPKLVPAVSTLQVSILGQVDEEWPSCCISLFLSFEPTAFNGCYHCHGILLPNRVLLDAIPHTSLDCEGCSAPDGRTWSSCPCPHIWQSYLQATAMRQHALLQHREGGKKWRCPLSTCLCVWSFDAALPCHTYYTCFKNSGLSGRRKRRGTNLFAS